MKKQQRVKKLELKKQDIARLDQRALKQVAGGLVMFAMSGCCPSCEACTTGFDN